MPHELPREPGMAVVEDADLEVTGLPAVGRREGVDGDHEHSARGEAAGDAHRRADPDQADERLDHDATSN